ncbi:MAG: endopeptidase [Thermoleophilaceae bacterium]|jgi:STE24 endopeptidase|nr:endopeptidase [Thermoleophilaceae bacterium]
MQSRDFRLPGAVVVAALATGAATLVLRPRSGLIQAAPAKAQGYFSPAQLDRIHDYVGPQRALGLGGLALTGGALALLALRPPRVVRRALERASARPLLGSAAAGAGISLGVAAVGLPLAAVSHSRSVDFGLSTQGWADWAADVAKSDAIAAVFAGGGALLLVALIRRSPGRWWLPAGVAVVALGAVFTFLAPVVLDPVFNRFTPLPAGALRSDVLGLAKRAGVHVGQVYRVDASRRTTGANAYVSGLGSTKRVVLYDNLIQRYTRPEVRSVVAHELGHVKHQDVPRGLLWLAIVALPATLVVQRLVERMAPVDDRGDGRAGPWVLPAAALSIALVSLATGVASNALSRRVEASADAYALRMTHDPVAFIGVERKLTTDNLGDPSPPRWLELLFGTHPPAVERIGYALTYERTATRR